MNKEIYNDYLELSGKITEKLDNTAEYENWLIIQDYIEQEHKKYINQKKVLDKIKELINHYAVENEDYSKIYNQEETEIMKLLEEIE